MTLTEFLVKLASDEAFRLEYNKDPPGVLRQEGLEDSQVKAWLDVLHTGTVKQIRVLVEVEVEVEGRTVRVASEEVFSHIYGSPGTD